MCDPVCDIFLIVEVVLLLLQPFCMLAELK